MLESTELETFRNASGLKVQRRYWISISSDHSRRRSGSGLRRIRSERERAVSTYASEPVHSISFICRIIVVFLFAAQGRTDARVHTQGTQGLCTREPRLSRPPRLAARRFCAVADSGKWYEACESQTRAPLPPERTESRRGTRRRISIDFFKFICHGSPSVFSNFRRVHASNLNFFRALLRSTRIRNVSIDFLFVRWHEFPNVR